MKKIIFIPLILFTVIQPICSQELDETEEMYLVALKKYSIELDSFYNKFRSPVDKPEIIYLEQTSLIDSIPTIIDGREIVILTRDNWRKEYRRNGRELIHLRIFPMKVSNGRIEIRLVRLPTLATILTEPC